MFKVFKNNKGVTLIELMIAMAVSGVVMAGVYSAYISQARSYNTQELTVEMQENLRVALDILQMDLRLAGSDLSGEADAGFVVAAPDSVQFTMDITGGENDGEDNNKNFLEDEGNNNLDDDGDGSVDEFDEGEWYDGDTDDSNEDIEWRLNGTDLLRNNVVVAENIQQLNLVYLDAQGNRLDDDGLGGVDTNIDDIRSVQITLIGTAGGRKRPLTYNYPDTAIYKNQVGETILDMSGGDPEELRRRMVSSQVFCRNMK